MLMVKRLCEALTRVACVYHTEEGGGQTNGFKTALSISDTLTKRKMLILQNRSIDTMVLEAVRHSLRNSTQEEKEERR